MTTRSKQFDAAMAAYDKGHEAEALALMERCALESDPVACYLTALWYQNGEGAPASDALSKRWLHELVRLAKSGNAEAQWEISCRYRWGSLLPCDNAAANMWLERAAQNGWGEAQHHLAWYLQTGQYGYLRDEKAAESWYQRAFEQGHPETLYTFALREFEDGHITERATTLLRLAADKGFKQAEHVLRDHIP
jgi:TPR repeat protein